MKQGLSLRASQHLNLTPQLQQSIRLLQLSTLELNQEIQVQLDLNPFLEIEESAMTDESTTLPLEGPASDPQGEEEVPDFEAPEPHIALDWQQLAQMPEFDSAAPWDGLEALPAGTSHLSPDVFDESSRALGTLDFSSPSAYRDQDDEDGLASFSAARTLVHHLEEQAQGLWLKRPEQVALHYLIGHLNEDGYLELPWNDLVTGYAQYDEFVRLTSVGGTVEQRLELASQYLEQGLGHLQDMDPLGVGARSLQECLRIQLLGLLSTPAVFHEWDAKERVINIGVALKVVDQPLELLAKRDIRQLAKRCAQPEKVVRAACELIRRLEPKPGRAFCDTRGSAITPEVLVRRSGGTFEAVLNQGVRPHLSVNTTMAQMIGSDKTQGGGPMQKALGEARWFVRSVEQRFQTILRVSQCIVLHQQAFFAHGPLRLKPMVLREVADALGLHESTVSRVTTAKFMATPQGTFELKYFFTSGLLTDNGSNTSSTAVRTLIEQWVATEDPKKPLSDQKLSEMLSDKGIDCARRTVAKYRESLKIAPTSLRRAH